MRLDDDTIKYLLRLAYEEAAESPDPSNQNGALVVDDFGNVLASSCNHVPAGIEVDLADREQKLRCIAHAEEAATVVAARLGVRTLGKTLVCPWFACMMCARHILLAGYRTVIGHRRRMDTTPERWRGEVAEAEAWLLRAGVALHYFDGEIPEAPAINVNGSKWQP